MMATNKPGVVQMKGGAYVILIMLIYQNTIVRTVSFFYYLIDIDISTYNKIIRMT